MTEGNLSHAEVFNAFNESRIMSAIDCHLYIGDERLFRRFVEYKTGGKLLKLFPETTLKEVRQWKKENK